METLITQVVVVEDGESIYHESATTITTEDEAAGEFITVSQSTDSGLMTLRIDAAEWPTLREAVDMMVSKCRG